MKQKNKIKLGEQIDIKFPLDEADDFNKGIEDIFGPKEEYKGNREEEITQSKASEMTSEIMVGRCDNCGEVVSLCSLCSTSITYCGKMICVEDTPNNHNHYCEECGKKWKITAEGRHYLEKHSLK